MALTRLLIIDDDPAACETLTDIFEEKGYSPESAFTGAEAIEKAARIRFNAALIDLKLPDMDGIDLLKRLKADYPEMVCVIVTGNASLQNAVEALKDGASGYFIKPLDLDDACIRIENLIDRQRLVTELSESEERFRGLVETSTDAIIIADEEGNITLWNKSAESMLGYSEDEVVGQPLTLIMREEKAPIHNASVKEYIETGECPARRQTLELHARRKDGVVIEIEISISSMRKKGAHTFIAIIRDITERKRRDNEFKEKVGELERMNKLMVGRELDMIKLKATVKELKARLGE